MENFNSNDSEQYFDVLKELGNIGAGNATTALSQMIQCKVDMKVPQVRLLDFQEEAGALNLTVYCRALDFGCKAYVNLVMLYTILQTVSEKAGMRHGRLTLIVKSALDFVTPFVGVWIEIKCNYK